MPEEKKFYTVLDGLDDLKPGKQIVVNHTVRIWGGAADLTPLVCQSEKELIARQKTSIRKEEQVYEKLRKATGEWEELGAQTLLLEKALEYVRTPEVAHTANEWRRQMDGTMEISNRTYKMWYRFAEESTGGPWRVYWGFDYNVPRQPEGDYNYQFTGDSIKIAGQNKKGYASQEAAQQYIQGRFDLYAHLFTELSPPIPENQKRMFSVNGHLLPGYTLAPPERAEPDKEAVNALLSCLDDGDIEATSADSQPEPPPAATPPKKIPAKKPIHPKQKKSAPVR